MNEHISSEAFATDLLAGNWAFIGGAGYSNVIMDTIYEGDVQVTATTGHDTYTLASSADNYDYAICTVKIYQTKGILVKETAVVPANSSQAISWSYGIGSGNAAIAVYGWVSFTADKTSIRFALRAKGSAIDSASLERVDGIKVNSMTLSEIAELSMPSDVYEEIPLNFTTNSSVWESVEYVTPTDGYVMVRLGTLTSASSTAQIVIETSNKDGVTSRWTSTSQPANTGRYISTEAPVVANRSVKVYVIWCNSTAEGNSVKFIYTVGATKELGLID